MRFLTLLLFVSAMALSAFADTYLLTKSEQKAIFEEAEDWIDDMPDGLQDHISDAVLHSLRGFFNELQYFRSLNDTIGVGKYKVSVTNLKGGKSGNIALRLYKPLRIKTGEKLPLLVFFHGGGWALGSVNTTDKFCRALVSEGNVAVVSVEYPLAPEFPYPSAINFNEGAVEYIFSKAADWGCDKNRISLGGEGAGGNLALETYQKLPANYKIKSLLLYYPVNVSTTLNQSDKKLYGKGYGFDSRLWEAFMCAYQGKESTASKKLPSTLLISAGRDIIISDQKEFSSHNPNVKFIEFDGAIHGFLTDGHQNTAFKKAVSITDQFLQTR